MEECFRGCEGPREERVGGLAVLDDSSHLPSAAAN